MQELEQNELWQDFIQELSAEEATVLQNALKEENVIADLLAGLKSIEESLPPNMSIKEYFDLRKAHLKDRIFNRNSR